MDSIDYQPGMRPYGESGLTVVDRFGVFLSRRPIRAVIAQHPDADVLDVGCGFEAVQLRDLAPRIRSGVGIDSLVSDGAKATPNLRFLEGTAEQMLPTLDPTTFDVVMMVSVLEHLWEPLEALRHCKRVLRPHGSLVVNVPTWMGKEALETAAFRLKLSTAEPIDDHKAYYDKRELWTLLVKTGFKSSQLRLRYHKFGLNLFAVARMP
jgi:SAM-dependent methyltransferase